VVIAMLIRAEFEKLEEIKYISHLELMTTFRRAFRRAKLPLAYSKGFNPHIQLALAQPLKVGMVGWKEYFDLQLNQEMEIKDFISLVNQELPPGLKINKAVSIAEDSKALMATINTARYIFSMVFKQENIAEEDLLNRFLAEEEIRVRRERVKKGDIEINIRPMIQRAQIIGPGKWLFQVESGSERNLRPEEISRALADFSPDVAYVPIVNIVREGLYVKVKEELYSPLDEKIVGR
jgi:radical SAM-linked protein